MDMCISPGQAWLVKRVADALFNISPAGESGRLRDGLAGGDEECARLCRLTYGAMPLVIATLRG